MKKYTYEITIMAADESEADSRMRGLSLLTACDVLQKKQDNGVLPLSEREEELIKLHRRGLRVAKILRSWMENPARIDRLADSLPGNK